MFPIITNLTNSLKLPDNPNEEIDDSDNETIISDSEDSEESLTDQQIEVNYSDTSVILKDVKKIFIWV